MRQKGRKALSPEAVQGFAARCLHHGVEAEEADVEAGPALAVWCPPSDRERERERERDFLIVALPTGTKQQTFSVMLK